MDAPMPDDIRELHDELDAAERDAEALVAGLTEEQPAHERRHLLQAWNVRRAMEQGSFAAAV